MRASLANDPAALAASVEGAADWTAGADGIEASSLWYLGSADGGGFSVDQLELGGCLGVETHSIAAPAMSRRSGVPQMS